MRNHRIKEGRINFISLCKRGANRMPVIYKADGAFDVEMLMKAADDFAERGEVLGVVYAPELRDTQGGIASATVIKDMMYDAAQRGESIDVMHDGKALTKDQIFVAERFIVQKGDDRFNDFKDYDGKTVDVTGAWATVLKIKDQTLRDQFKKGDWNGLSMGGVADLELEKSASLADKVVEAFVKKLGLSDNEDNDMDAAEYQKLMTENNKVLADAIGKSVGEAIAKGGTSEGDDDKDKGGNTDTDKNKAPVFKGDPAKAEDVEKHQDALAKWELSKDVDWSSAESVKDYHAKLADLKKKADADADEGKSEEVKKLEAEKAEVQKKLDAELGKSNQGGTGGDGKDDDKPVTVPEGMSKEDARLLALGHKIGKAQNEATQNK